MVWCLRYPGNGQCASWRESEVGQVGIVNANIDCDNDKTSPVCKPYRNYMAEKQGLQLENLMVWCLRYPGAG